MRVLLDATTDVGLRAGKALLAESAVEWIGVWDEPAAAHRSRSGPAFEVAGHDVAVTDRTDHLGDFIARCSVAGVPVAVWHDAVDLARGGAVVPVVVGANVGSALAEVLVHHPAAQPGPEDTVEIAWTEPGTPRRTGTPFPFPDPIGMSRTQKRSPGRFVAYRNDEWSGAVIRVAGPDGDRIVGVSDHGAYLEALVLASTALCAADGVYETGVVAAASAGEQLMNRIESVELDFAVWRSHS